MRFMAVASVTWASRLMRAEGHGPGGEALDDLGRGLDLVERHRAAPDILRRLDAEQPAQGLQLVRLVVHHRENSR
jgi:hypothetical protein